MYKIGFQYSKHCNLSLIEQIDDAYQKDIRLFDIFFDDFLPVNIDSKMVDFILSMKEKGLIFSIHSPIVNYLDNYKLLDQLINIANAIIPFSITFHFNEISLKEIEYLNRNLNDNIKISIENTIPDLSYDGLCYIEKMNMFSIHLNNLYSTFDIGHCNINYGNPDIYLEKILQNNIKVSTFHFHNNFQDKDSHNNLEDGNIDINSLVKKILKTNKDFIIIIENYQFRVNSYNFLKSIIDENQ